MDRAILDIMTDAMAGVAGSFRELALRTSDLQREMNKLAMLSNYPDYIIREEPW